MSDQTVNVKFKFVDGGDFRVQKFQEGFFIPHKGDRIRLDNQEQLYIVEDRITHLLDDSVDFTLVLREET